MRLEKLKKEANCIVFYIRIINFAMIKHYEIIRRIVNSMKARILLLMVVAMHLCAVARGERAVPGVIVAPAFSAGHVQGIAVDIKDSVVYLSYTTMIAKVDFRGHLIGTATGLAGHLGCLDFNDSDGCVYGSLEYKDDAIGRGILKRLGSTTRYSNAFYVARIDGRRITREGMDAARDGIMTVACLPEVLGDYSDTVTTGGRRLAHRYACSGIDGICVGPRIGSRKSEGQYVTVAYGVYGDTTRTDNDYQVIRQYSLASLRPYFRTLTPEAPVYEGPARSDVLCFVHTGNTDWGVQNLEYDRSSGLWFMAVYRGKKSRFPNYNLYAFSQSSPLRKQRLTGVDYERGKHYVLPLAAGELSDPATGVTGWMKPAGGCFGLHSLGDGLFYVADIYKDRDGRQGARIRLFGYDPSTRHFTRLNN